MKKCLVILFILLLSCVSAFSLDIPPETVKITANVPDGTGVDGGNSISLGGGVFLTIAIPRDNSSGIPNNTAPTKWESNYESIGGNETVIAKLVDTDTTEGACEKFYLAYGLKGNPSKRVNVKISAEVDGWYPGTTGAGESKASEKMTISSNTVPINPSQTFITASGNNAVCAEFDNGLATSEVLVGYSEITWGIEKDYTPPAGDYSATVTITITPEGEVSNGGESV